jgi:transposase
MFAQRSTEMTLRPITHRVETTATTAQLYVSFELGDKLWKLTCSDGRRGPSRYTIAAGIEAEVVDRICRAKAHFGLADDAIVHSCYEAGRDGWWLHRWLLEQGIDNIVVDAASIEVNRRSRRAKTDRLDGDKLLAMLLRYHAGEKRVWSVVHAPSAQEEDARRTHRELARLTQERTAHTNRIGSLLVLHNLRPHKIGGRDWAHWWAEHCAELAPALRAEVEREMARLELVKNQLKSIEASRLREVSDGRQPLIAQLLKLRAIGVRSAWLLDKELFGWRRFANRRELAGCLGLTPTPYASGESQIEQGISKAGNKRARALLVDLAWGWLRLQPCSALSQWFARRFAAGGRRMRRVGIVAVARKLAIALWRYLAHGEIPAGAVLKPSLA